MNRLRFWERVSYKKNGLSVSTDGLLSRGQAELVVPFTSGDLLNEAEAFLRFVVKYLDETGAIITSGQTLGYGYWLVKFQASDENTLEVWEYNSDATAFVRGGSLTLSYWRDQHAVCEKNGASFDPPDPERLTVVSAGVMELGHPVQAVRYPWAEPMSGWMIVTELYDGNIESLIHHHTYHVTAARPDLAKYLALPHGFRFDSSKGDCAAFDPEAASQRSV